jgi:hypothetical protein
MSFINIGNKVIRILQGKLFMIVIDYKISC